MNNPARIGLLLGLAGVGLFVLDLLLGQYPDVQRSATESAQPETGAQQNDAVSPTLRSRATVGEPAITSQARDPGDSVSPIAPASVPPAESNDRLDTTYLWDGRLTAEQQKYLAGWAEPATRYHVFARGSARNLPRRIRRLKDGAYMVAVWCDEFLMGVGLSPDKNIQPDASPDVHVKLSNAFYMDETEVTLGQWAAYLQSTPDGLRASHEPEDSGLPIVGVPHSAALAFAAWAGVDLPTEAQWECAAKACNVVVTYPYGVETAGNVAAFRYWTGRREDGPTSVAQYPPNAFGLYDLGGNAAEWCRDVYRSDFYGLTLGSPRIDPFCADVGVSDVAVAHVVRGGSWFSPKEELRVFHRSRATDDAPGVGLRCVKLIPWPVANAPWCSNERERH